MVECSTVALLPRSVSIPFRPAGLTIFGKPLVLRQFTGPKINSCRRRGGYFRLSTNRKEEILEEFRLEILQISLQSDRMTNLHLNMTMLPPDPLYIFKGEMLPVSCVAFKVIPDMERIYAGTQSGNVHVWNLKSRREIGNFKAGDDTCISICVPEEEDVIITHTKSGCISFWNECGDNEWKLKKLLKIDFFGFCKCQIFENVLYAPLKGSKCDLISVKAMNSIQTVELGDGELGEIMAFKVCDTNKRKTILVAHEAHKLVLWDFDGLKRISSLDLEECPMAVDYDVNTNKGLSGDPSDNILIFSLDKNLELKKMRSVKLTNPGVASVRIRPDGKLVAVGCWDGKVRLYSWKTLVLLAALDTHNSTVQEVSFSENYREGSKVKYLLAAGSQDTRISLWDLYN